MVETNGLLILGYGNPSRGDDGLAAEFIDRLEHEKNRSLRTCGAFSILKEFQLQIENTLDLEQYPMVLLVDASSVLSTPFKLTRVRAFSDSSYSSHALSPAALLAVFEQTSKMSPPAVYLLAIKGLSFELGDPLSLSAEQNLQSALNFSRNLIRQQKLAYWDQCVDKTAD